MMTGKWQHRGGSWLGLSLLEVLIAVAIFSTGMILLLTLFPHGTQAALNAEVNSRAAILAQTIMEGLRFYPSGNGQLCFMIGDRVDNDADGRVDEEAADGQDNDDDGKIDEDIGRIAGMIIPGNGIDEDTALVVESDPMLRDYRFEVDRDGLPELDVLLGLDNGFDDDGDGLVDDDGDSGAIARDEGYKPKGPEADDPLADGMYNYDPTVLGSGTGIDEEFPDGIDNDGDGLIDEDLRLPTQRLVTPLEYEVIPSSDLYRRFQRATGLTVTPGTVLRRRFDPVQVGDGMDNDGRGVPGERNIFGVAVADGVDNNGDGRIDEGIDEEIFNGRDDDDDGLIDEDVAMVPVLILAPHMYGKDSQNRDIWLTTPRRIFAPVRWPRMGQRQMDFDKDRPMGNSDNEDGRAGQMFEDQFFFQIFVGPVSDNAADGIDDDGDSLGLSADERTKYIDEETRDGLDNDGDGLIDEDLRNTSLRDWLKVRVVVTWGGDLRNNELDNENNADVEDPFIDEEALDGLDNDGDGLIDEDVYRSRYVVTGVIPLRKAD